MTIPCGLSRPFGPHQVPDRIDHEALRRHLAEWDASSAPRDGQDPCDRVRPQALVPDRATAPQRLRPSQRAPLARPEEVILPGDPGHAPRCRQGSDTLRLAEIEAVARRPEVQAALAALRDRMTMPTGLRGWWHKRFGPKVESVEMLASRLVNALRAACEGRKRAGEVTAFRHVQDAVDATAATLVQRAAEAASPEGRSRWRRRVESQRAGSFVAAVRAQQRRSFGPTCDLGPNALLPLDSSLSRLLSRMRLEGRGT